MSRPVNIYELLDDDNEKGKAPVAQQQKPKTQTTTTQAKASTQQVNRAPARNQDNRKPREENRSFGDQQQVSDRKPRGERKTPKGGEFTEVRAPRNPNQRQYDRKSGTGRGRENKRAGGGRGNWGSVNDEVKTVEETEKVETEAPATDAAPAEATAEPTAEVKVEEEEEEKVKTLDEYLGTIKKVNISLPAPRQAGEGQEANSKWATYTALKKDDDEDKKVGAEKKKPETKESSKQTISADQVIHFKESPKGERSFRGGRGGRGGRRGGEGSPRGGRGGRRGGNSGARAPGLTEENFPALKA